MMKLEDDSGISIKHIEFEYKIRWVLGFRDNANIVLSMLITFFDHPIWAGAQDLEYNTLR